MSCNAHIFFSRVFFFFFFLFITLNTIQVSCKGSILESESHVLACGATSDGTDSDGRKWLPDTKYMNSSSNSITATADNQDPSLPSTVPYMTARIFTSPTTYKFSVPAKRRVWVRLHFYPATYSSLEPNSSYFSVSANKFQLLKNFSASITCKALTMAYVIREFSISPIETGTLDLTFTPSKDYDDTYAFVNGIEVIPMPNMFTSGDLIGFDDQSLEISANSLQTMYRLNVGGQYIPATNDSGLTRIWYDDTPYLYGAAVGVTGQANFTLKYPTKEVPKTIAPLSVYSTARTMGVDNRVNSQYNLTWILSIDANFTYLVRLHFCELVYTRVNQRTFNIFINNQTAQEGADVIGWAGAKATPFYKDFAIAVPDKAGDDQIWVALHPAVEMKPEYYDAILNGLEVFKVSDATGNLAGPNPVPSDMLLEAEAKEAKEFSSKGLDGPIIGGIAGGAAGLTIAFIISVFAFKKKRGLSGSQSGSHNWLPLYGNSHTSGSKSTLSGKSSASSHLSSLAQGLCRHFSLPEIKHATKNFNERNVIGIGGFGKVYKGVIDQGTKVAIKRSNPSSEQGVNEFQTEIEMLSKLRHKHLVSLIGFCEEDGEMALVYDYMANGTLREHIYKGTKPTNTLSWKQRLEICIGAARGLHYLHTGAKYTIIHRDVKTTNILLDDKWVAKVSDFGLSKTGPNLNENHVSTVVKGSFGYLDPEYFKRQQLTEKSDVYSFGVVLFEALCARPALNPTLPKEQVSLADWALHCQKKGIIEDIVDPHIKSEILPECLKKFAETAEKCLSDHGIYRPSMGDVLWNLEFCLQLQDNPAGAKLVSEMKSSDTYAMDRGMLSIEEESSVSEDSNTEIFSQIVHPRGR
ncbi:hypothetical protein JCGZ_18995 [Jatropha curcas]|uniref:non-specific serine/threonine protein kinase n=1 Tax=Jatropha curcas TaxID=180498 RepID=A0A067K6L8_JATCU|nr:receptor-like protein kinase ANXUR1 [Jatropha curcas]KDP27915.1 hypothetical protein JCGZ_18995 [Jatropha curcas]